MNITTLLLVAAGGAIGSVLRALAAFVIPSSGRLPWATITVNVAGSLVIGVLVARMAASSGTLPSAAHAFWVVGVCGGFTTFSAFSWQTVEQLQKGDWVAAMANVFVSLVVCLAATTLGWRLAR